MINQDDPVVTSYIFGSWMVTYTDDVILSCTTIYIYIYVYAMYKSAKREDSNGWEYPDIRLITARIILQEMELHSKPWQ